MTDDELFNMRAVWYVRHADGTTEDIVLQHGDLVEDSRGTCGQVLFYNPTPENVEEPT